MPETASFSATLARSLGLLPGSKFPSHLVNGSWCSGPRLEQVMVVDARPLEHPSATGTRFRTDAMATTAADAAAVTMAGIRAIGYGDGQANKVDDCACDGGGDGGGD